MALLLRSRINEVKKNRKRAPGSLGYNILLTHNAWSGALCFVVGFVHVHSSHMQSLTVWTQSVQRSWSGTWKITGICLEMFHLKWPRSSHEGKAIPSFAVPCQGQNNLSLSDYVVEIFGKRGGAFLNVRYAGDVDRTLENSLCLKLA